jgi:hypothetical protein
MPTDRPYKTFVQKNGPRKDQKYTIKRGKSGLLVKVYESGDTALVNRSGQDTSKLGVYDLAQKRRRNPNAPRNPYV